MPRSPSTIALLTDFGTSDWYVASMKAIIARVAPQSRVIDITHEIDLGNVPAGAFALSQCYDDFPDQTVFLCVVDPEVGSNRRPIIVYTGDYYFVAPDNGLLGLVKPSMYRSFQIDPDLVDLRLKSSSTFHGRDLFAPAAALLASGAAPSELGKPISRIASLDFQFGVANALPMDGFVIYFDRFGNGITNLKVNAFGPFPRSVSLASGRSVPYHATYADVPVGQPVAYLGSGGLVEIAVNRGNARQELALDASPEFVLR